MKPSIRTFCRIVWGLGAPAVVFAADTPVVVPLEHYQTMIGQSPFSIASASAPPVATESVGFAKDFVLTGVVRLNKGEYVTIATRDQSRRFGLMAGEIYNGISVASIAWAEGVGKTKVTLKRGSEYGVIGFDEAAAHSNAAGSEAVDAGGRTLTTVPGAQPRGKGRTTARQTDPSTEGQP